MTRDLFGFDKDQDRRHVPAGERVQQANLVEIAADLRHDGPLAYLVFDGAVEAWLPKALTENNGDGTFTVPQWLARSKGLI